MINTGVDDVARRGTLRLLAGLVAAAAVLSGCADKQPANETLPSTSAAPSTAALPPLGPKEFPVPANAREKTPDGAVAFVRYYVNLTKFLAEKSLDPKPLLELSVDCRTCSMIASSLAEDRAASYKYRNYSFQFTDNGPGLIHGDTAEMGFVYIQGPITVVNQTGSVVPSRSTGVSGKLQSGAILRWRSEIGSWVITTLTVG